MSLLRRAARKHGDLHGLVASVPFWYHSIDLGGGVVTPGVKPPDSMAAHLGALQLPDLHGKSFLDIGAWDGFFSFEAERRGARRIVALDHYVWSMQLTPAGVPQQGTPGAWQPDTLPGKRGFDVAHAALGSAVEAVVSDFMDADLSMLGTFDVVLFSGVLYHLENPFEALRRLSAVTDGVAIIETAAVSVPGFADARLVEFYPGGDLNTDPGNWWAPSEPALLAMCTAAGFADAGTVWTGRTGAAESGEVERHRIVVHATKSG